MEKYVDIVIFVRSGINQSWFDVQSVLNEVIKKNYVDKLFMESSNTIDEIIGHVLSYGDMINSTL